MCFAPHAGVASVNQFPFLMLNYFAVFPGADCSDFAVAVEFFDLNPVAVSQGRPRLHLSREQESVPQWEECARDFYLCPLL